MFHDWCAFIDSRLRGNDGERFARMARTHDYAVIDLSLSFPRRRESIGHHSDPHWGSFLESTESSMPGSIFSGASNQRFLGCSCFHNVRIYGCLVIRVSGYKDFSDILLVSACVWASGQVVTLHYAYR